MFRILTNIYIVCASKVLESGQGRDDRDMRSFFVSLTMMIRKIQTTFFTILFVISWGCEMEQTKSTAGFYIGTYTSGDSKGIYYSTLDQETGKLSQPILAAETLNPSFLVQSQDRDYLYAVNEDLGLESTSNAGISAFRVDAPGKLTETGIISSEGAYACYISISSNDDFLMAANYGSGNVISVALEAPGAFGPDPQVVLHTGSGPNTERQESPHAHSIVLDPNERFALAADLGIDKIMVYRVDEDGMLTPNDPPFAELPPGSGPRHIDFHPEMDRVYVISELSSTVTVFNYDPDVGSLSRLQTVTTLPEDFDGESYCADIHIHPNGKFLYGSNRGHDSIVIYQIEEDGTLVRKGFFMKGVNWPRNFVISPDGRFLVIANQNGDDIITAEINPDTGLLSATGSRIEVPSPVCIAF